MTDPPSSEVSQLGGRVPRSPSSANPPGAPLWSPFAPATPGWIARIGPATGDIITPSGELFTDGVIVTPAVAEQARTMGNVIGALFASHTDPSELRNAKPDFDTLPLLNIAMEQGNLLGTMVSVAWLNTDPSPTIRP